MTATVVCSTSSTTSASAPWLWGAVEDLHRTIQFLTALGLKSESEGLDTAKSNAEEEEEEEETVFDLAEIEFGNLISFQTLSPTRSSDFSEISFYRYHGVYVCPFVALLKAT